MNLFIVFTLVIIPCTESVLNNDTLRPNLRVGEYNINLKRIIPCDPGKNNKIQINLYLNKTSKTTSELKGNITVVGTQIDDSLIFKASFDLQDYTGGWSENSFVFRRNKACSVYQWFWKKPYLTALGTDKGCPVTEGVYITTGITANNMENVLANVPKVFFYGTYRLRLTATDKKNEQLGCFYPVVEIKRPWEN